MSEVRFTVPGEPVSKSRHRMGTRGGKVIAYKDAKTTNAQEQVGWCYRQAAKGLPPNEIDGFTVTMVFHVGQRQRRDVDNFVKLVLDGLTPLAWADDSQVTDIHAMVRHGSDDPRSEVIVESNDHLPDWKRRICEHCTEALDYEVKVLCMLWTVDRERSLTRLQLDELVNGARSAARSSAERARVPYLGTALITAQPLQARGPLAMPGAHQSVVAATIDGLRDARVIDQDTGNEVESITMLPPIRTTAAAVGVVLKLTPLSALHQ